MLWAIVALLILSGCKPNISYPTPPNDGRYVLIEGEQLKDSEPSFYSVDVEGVTVSFFVVRRGGDVRAFFDACEKCYPEGKGYRVQGEGVSCNTCNVRYPVEELETGLGSCHPIPLPSTYREGIVRIALADLADGCRLFR